MRRKELLALSVCVFEGVYCTVTELTVVGVERENMRSLRCESCLYNMHIFLKKLASGLTFTFSGLGTFRT